MPYSDFIYRQLVTLNAGRPGRPRPFPRQDPPAALGLSDSMLRIIAEQRKRGESFSSIAAALNKQGLRGSNGGRWYSASVREYLLRHVGVR